ncbi:very-long-chain 3-oxoacyl-CoA reductase-like, partial [Saccoglossus kowalevskii]|uniref:Estradiol 17-beta-dehydrogenase 12-like n=1 Tax=Saccoglossus kowalevskii TaxID=10224 RepID=A0ABM0MZI5_SACKO
VTGCTNGIGKEYARQLAEHGVNIALLSRSKEKLLKVAKEIESSYHVKTKIIVVDFTGGYEIYQDIKTQLKDLDIGVLVNNVGIGMSVFEFLEIEDLTKKVTDIVNVNVLAATKMTQLVLPCMVGRKKGVIINISSSAGRVPVPLMMVYSSTKAYMDFFSRGLNEEYKHKGIIVQCVMPYFVSTNMTMNRKPSLFWPTSRAYVTQSLRTVGWETKTYGYIMHHIQGLQNRLPQSMTINLIYSVLKPYRQMALKKRNSSKKTL